MVGAVPLRVVFFGTPAFAAATLDHLLASRHQVVAVVTQPDRPRGRGQQVVPGAVKALALTAGLTVLQPEKLMRDVVAPQVEALRADLGVVAAYGKILPEWLIALPRLGLINVHASLLPRYRGAAPVHRAVINGDPVTGVTIMRVVKALDAGPMLATVEVPIGPDDTSHDVETRLALAGAALLVDTVDRLAQGPVAETAQDEGASTYAPRLRKEEGLIDWTMPAAAIHNQVRGLHPWPHAFTFGPRGRLIVHRARPGLRDTAGIPPGTVLTANRSDGLSIATGAGDLHLLEIQSEGGRVLPADAFLAGHPLQPGDVLGVR